MRKRLLLTLGVLVFASCHYAQTNLLVEEFKTYPMAQIQHNGKAHESYNIAEGTFDVFEYSSNNAGDPGNSSNAPTIFVFQIQNQGASFELSDKQIADHGGLYIQRCQCQDKGLQEVKKGTIIGEKSDDGTWHVTIDVWVDGNRTGKKYHITATSDYQWPEK